MTIKGYTIQEMADILDISYSATHKRLQTAEIGPLTKEAIYPESALAAIRSVPGKGRPRKTVSKPGNKADK